MLGLVGLASKVETDSWPLEGFEDRTADGTVLGSSEAPRSFKEKYSQPAMGVRRTELNLKLKQMLIDLDVDVREGWELEDIEETDDGVTAHFNGGRSAAGSFLIGCDGIKAASRKILLRKQGLSEGQPPSTGLTQTAGLAPMPQSLKNKSAMRNWFGEGVHCISYPVSPDVISWALTLPGGDGAEADWGLVSGEEMVRRKQELLSKISSWQDKSVAEMIQGATRIIKFGLFDREEMNPAQWHSGRCVLVGDAAHPTSPHLGQGANQAL